MGLALAAARGVEELVEVEAHGWLPVGAAAAARTSSLCGAGHVSALPCVLISATPFVGTSAGRQMQPQPWHRGDLCGGFVQTSSEVANHGARSGASMCCTPQFGQYSSMSMDGTAAAGVAR